MSGLTVGLSGAVFFIFLISSAEGRFRSLFIVSGSGGDSAVVYFWGTPESEAFDLAPGETATVTAYLGTVRFEANQPVPALDFWGTLIMIGLLGGLILLKRKGLV